MSSIEWSFRGSEVESEKVREVCTKTWDAFRQAIDELDVCESSLAEYMQQGEIETLGLDSFNEEENEIVAKKLVFLYGEVVSEFFDKTKITLELDCPAGENNDTREFWVATNLTISNPEIDYEKYGHLLSNFDVICGG